MHSSQGRKTDSEADEKSSTRSRGVGPDAHQEILGLRQASTGKITLEAVKKVDKRVPSLCLEKSSAVGVACRHFWIRGLNAGRIFDSLLEHAPHDRAELPECD